MMPGRSAADARMPRCACAAGAALALAVLLAGALAGCGDEKARLETHLANAERYEREGRLEEATLELKNALRADPARADTNLRLARVLERRDKLEDAVFFYREAHRLDPTLHEAAVAEARLRAPSEPAEARALLEEVLETDPGNALAYATLSYVDLVDVDTLAALTAARTAVELAPEDPRTHLQLGRVHQARIREARVGRGEQPPDTVFREAVRAFERAAELFREAGDREGLTTALFERARVLGAWPGHTEEAAAAYRKLLAHARETGDEATLRAAARAVANYARAAGAADLAREALEVLVGLSGSDLRPWHRLAALEAAKGGDPEGVYRRLVRERPRDGAAWSALARWLARAGRLDQALEVLTEGEARAGDPKPVLGARAELLYAAGRGAEADAAVERLVGLAPESLEATLARARQLLARRRFADAADLLEAASDRFESAELESLRGLAELGRRNLPAALAAANRSVELEPSAAALRLKARIQAASRDWQGALQTWRELLRTGARLDPAEQLSRAVAFYETGRGELGRRILERLLEAEPPSPRVVLVWLRREGEGDPERARTLLERALAAHPDHPGLLRARAERALAAGHPEEALAALDRAAKGRGGPVVHMLRARILAGLGRLEEAERAALDAFELAPGRRDVMETVVAVYAAAGKLDRALASFEEADSVGALGPPGLLLLARLRLARGRVAEAREALERALEAQPGLVGARNDLAYLLAAEGRDLDRAQRLAQEAVDARPEDPEALDTLGFVYLKRGLLEPALAAFDHAVELAEAGEGAVDPALHYHRGLALRALGRNREAVAALQRALADESFAERETARSELEAARAAEGGGADAS